MTLKVFSILDVVANAFNAPFFFPTVGQAVRAFKDLANDPSSTLSRHPEDYALFELGTFEDSTGRLVALEVPNRLGRATDYLDRRGEAAARIVDELKDNGKVKAAVTEVVKHLRKENRDG